MNITIDIGANLLTILVMAIGAYLVTRKLSQ